MTDKIANDSTFADYILVFHSLEESVTRVAHYLRKFFGTDDLAKKMGYWHAEDVQQTQIQIRSIFEVWNGPEPFYPQIVVNIGPFSLKLGGFGGYEEQWTQPETGEVFEQVGGRGSGGIRLELSALTPKSRVQISDLTLTALAVHWNDLAKVGIETKGDPRFEGWGETNYPAQPSKKIHNAKFSLPYEYNWYRAKRLTGPTVDSVGVDATITGEPTVVFDPEQAFNDGYPESEG